MMGFGSDEKINCLNNVFRNIFYNVNLSKEILSITDTCILTGDQKWSTKVTKKIIDPWNCINKPLKQRSKAYQDNNK